VLIGTSRETAPSRGSIQHPAEGQFKARPERPAERADPYRIEERG
jgi:hypothetical protein